MKTFANGVGGIGVRGDFPAPLIFVHSAGVLQNEPLVFMIPQAFLWNELRTEQAGNTMYLSRRSQALLMPDNGNSFKFQSFYNPFHNNLAT